MNFKKKIINRVKSLNEIDDVQVVVSEEQGSIDIEHCKKHSANFRLKWVDDNHYVGYFVDSDGIESQAIISIWNDIESIKFVSMYLTMIELRAKREFL